jgi:hypothetical protein
VVLLRAEGEVVHDRVVVGRADVGDLLGAEGGHGRL